VLLALGAAPAAAQPPAAVQPPARQAAGACPASLPELYDQVAPAVVSITAISINPYDAQDRIQRVVGSGVIIDPQGLVLSNSHVVYGRQVITVTLDDGTPLPARLVGADPTFDIAVLRIPAPKQGALPVARMGDSSKLLVGEEVYAIGNPLGLEQTLTRGIVSAINRLLPGTGWSLTEPLIQTDAAINPGNSGGPLVDSCGAVVGITTAILPQAQSIGFAVPVDLVRDVLPELVEKGRVVRTWLGVQGQFVPQALKELLRVPLVDGFLVEAVEPGSPADVKGVLGGMFEVTLQGDPILLGGDIITQIGGTKISDPATLARLFGELKVGAKLKLTVFREGKLQDVELTLGERPMQPMDLPGRSSATDPGRSDPTLAQKHRVTRRTFVF
jgi:S1-C subfamily serine protease